MARPLRWHARSGRAAGQVRLLPRRARSRGLSRPTRRSGGTQRRAVRADDLRVGPLSPGTSTSPSKPVAHQRDHRRVLRDAAREHERVPRAHALERRDGALRDRLVQAARDRAAVLAAVHEPGDLALGEDRAHRARSRRRARRPSAAAAISSSEKPSARAMTSRNLPVPAAHLSFISKSMTLPLGAERDDLRVLPADVEHAAAPGNSARSPGRVRLDLGHDLARRTPRAPRDARSRSPRARRARRARRTRAPWRPGRSPSPPRRCRRCGRPRATPHRRCANRCRVRVRACGRA